MRAVQQVKELRYDMSLTITTIRNRTDKKPQNLQTCWRDFIERVMNPKVTKETMAAYDATPEKKGAIKDVGGFIGGPSVPGAPRNSASVEMRSMFTLDADHGSALLWARFVNTHHCAALIHSTHSDRPGERRLRICGPFSRPIGPEEYSAVCRRITYEVGMESFDDTTYQHERLMYWPSVSVDQRYAFDYMDAPPIDVDVLLASYGPDDAWRDQANGLLSPKELAAGQTVRVGGTYEPKPDSTLKPGIIGLFNRTYTLYSAIDTFLPDIYEPGIDAVHYSFIGGTGQNGLEVFNNGYCISRHDTDPAHNNYQHEYNAFDLVRLHRFGAFDKGVPVDTPITDYPSYLKMVEFAEADTSVRQMRIEEAKAELLPHDGAGESGAAVVVPWVSRLVLNQNTFRPLALARNINLILDNDLDIQGKIIWDMFSAECSIAEPFLCWARSEPGGYWTDADSAGLRQWFETAYSIKGERLIRDAFLQLLERNSFHPVQDYLNGLVWDKAPRIDGILPRYLGAPDTAYSRAVLRKTLIGAVARVMEPGCTLEASLVLVGGQGAGKSRLVERLGRHQQNGWYGVLAADVTKVDTKIALRGNWIIEMGEVDTMRKSDTSSMKAFLSAPEDKVRNPYGEFHKTYKRQCVFIGTTNDDEFLVDPTGNRRYWPVQCRARGFDKTLFDELDANDGAEVSQWWAEAMAAYKAGESWFLADEVKGAALEAQRQYMITDDRRGIIESLVEKPITEAEDWFNKTINERVAYLQNEFDVVKGGIPRDKICAAEVWCEGFNNPLARMTAKDKREILAMFAGLEGWHRHENGDRGRLKFGADYGKQVAYVRDGAVLNKGW